MSIVVGETPEIYIQKLDSLISYPDHRTPLDSIVKDLGPLRDVSKKVLSNLCKELTELSISFHISDIYLEQDAEMELWTYAYIQMDLRLDEDMLKRLKDSLIDRAYSNIAPEDAVKTLLVLEHVQPH